MEGHGGSALPGGPWRAEAMIYAFEECDLGIHRYELRYVGKLVKLEPQVFNILAYLN